MVAVRVAGLAPEPRRTECVSAIGFAADATFQLGVGTAGGTSGTYAKTKARPGVGGAVPADLLKVVCHFNSARRWHRVST